MVNKKVVISIGALVIVILTYSLYITLPGKEKILFEDTYTQYSINVTGNWVLGATEYVYLYDGTKKMRASSRNLTYRIFNKTLFYLDEGNITHNTTRTYTEVTRFSVWKDNITTEQIYLFNVNSTDFEKFPIENTFTCHNCEGKIVHFEIRDIEYKGVTREAYSGENIGHKLKVEWQSGYDWAKIYNQIISDKIIIRYRPTKNLESYKVRIFDPPMVPLINGQYANQTYELGSDVNLTFNNTLGSQVCFLLPIYGIYACSTGSNSTIVSFPILYYAAFNDSSLTKTVISSGSVVNIRADNASDLKNVSVNITGSTNPVENLTLDIGNDGVIDYRLPGLLGPDYLTLYEFTNGLSSEEFSFSGGDSYTRFIDFPGEGVFEYNISMGVQGRNFVGNFTLNFSTEQYKDIDNTESTWDTTNQVLSMTPNINNHSHYNITVYYPNPPGGGSYLLTDDSGGTSYYNTVFNVFDGDTGTASVFTVTAAPYQGYIRVSKDFAANGVDSDEDVDILYRLTSYVEAPPSAYVNPILALYNWDTSSWNVVDSTCTSYGSYYCDDYGCPCDSGLKTYTVDDSNRANYVNSTGSILYRIQGYNSVGTGGAADDAYTVISVYDVTQTDLTYYDNRSVNYQDTTTLNLLTSVVTITNITLNISVNDSQASTYFVSADGTNFEDATSAVNTVHTHNFTTNGTKYYVRFRLLPTDMTTSPVVQWVDLFNALGGYPMNISLDLGNDGIYDYFFNGTINETHQSLDLTVNLSARIENYTTSDCADNFVSGCQVPFVFYSPTSGFFNITVMNFTSRGSDANPMSELRVQNITPFRDSCSGIDCDIAVNVSWKTGDNLTFNEIRLGYLGHGNLSINLFDNSTTPLNETVYLYVYYSKWNDTLPNNIDYIDFYPTYPWSQDVVPFGQTDDIAIQNVTTHNEYRNMNWSIYLNNSNSCVDVTVSTTNSKAEGVTLANQTWTTILSNVSDGCEGRIWYWVDLDCSYGDRIWMPDFYYRGCCVDCICDEVI